MPADHGPELPTSTADLQAMRDVRRKQLQDEGAQLSGQPTWGLALSGGGIRSATFCFGLLKALAQNGIFHRFDLLSTVSGGGYIGSTVGKLFQTAQPGTGAAQQVEKALAEADKTWFSLWLRANGRYLIPNGARDGFFAAANFGRNLLGVHIELALLGILAGCLLGLFDTAVWQCADRLHTGGQCALSPLLPVASLSGLAPWPTQWLLLVPLVLVAGVVAAAYWALPVQGQRMNGWRWLLTGLCAVAAWVLYRNLGLLGSHKLEVGQSERQGLSLLAACLTLAVLLWSVLGTLLAGAMSISAKPMDSLRNRLTTWLGWLLQTSIVVAAVGVMDVMAWYLAAPDFKNHGVVAGVLAFTVVVARAVLPKLADLPKGLTPGIRLSFMACVNILGIAVLVFVLVFWISVVHRNATMTMFSRPREGLDFVLSYRWLIVFIVPPGLIVLCSCLNREFLNRSSLFSFYRARLIRSYLGAANVRRFTSGAASPLDNYPRDLPADALSVAVQQVEQGDDEPMAGYQPHLAGGPVHLINVCVNQTCDPRGGLFNRDRKGLPMTIGPCGQVRVGQEPWRPVGPAGSMTLGSWMAISGAAVAPGLGASTRSGLSALLMLAGVRLGYWWDSESGASAKGRSQPPTVGKYGQLLAELRGRFDGVQKRDWYLSDGGHFENTAAYALLREQCGLIVVADCGADPRFSFGDLENLVRKARIDLQTEIRFLKPNGCAATGCFPLEHWAEAAAAMQEPLSQREVRRLLRSFGSLNDLASPDSHACLALARIEYGGGVAPGYLVVVKPNICEGLPVDLVNFKADQPLFPQEPTTDQFFSESQWESYFQLGNSLGRQLDPRFLANIGVFSRSFFEDDDGSIMAVDADGRAHAAPALKRLPSRIAATGAVTASLSLGAILTLGATLWQAGSTHLEKLEHDKVVDAATLKELTGLYAALPSRASTATATAVSPAVEVADDPAATALAAVLVRINESACNSANSAAYKESNVVQMALSSAKEHCRSTGLAHPTCKLLVTGDGRPSCVDREDLREGSNCRAQYWVHSFDRTPGRVDNCPPLPDAPEPDSASEWATFLGLSWPSWPAGPGRWFDFAALREMAGLGLNELRSDLVHGGPPEAPAAAGTATPETVPAPVGQVVPAETAAPPAAKPRLASCSGKTIYIQIFGPELRATIDEFYRQPLLDLGAKVPSAEDVLDSARRDGTRPPSAPAVPTAIFHDPGSQDCAESFKGEGGRTNWSIRPLTPGLRATPGVVEIWLPPTSDATAAAVRVPGKLPETAFCYQEMDPAASLQRYGVHCHADEARCLSARGANHKRIQSECTSVQKSAMGKLAPTDRGWAGSFYRKQATSFDAPFPQLPASSGN